MPRGLDTTLAAELAKGVVRPCFLGEITFASGVERVWTGVGPMTWNGKTFSGLGELVGIGSIAESSDVRANGTSASLAVMPSQVSIAGYPVTPPAPPRATNPGENLAWSFAEGWGVISTGVDGSALINQTTGYAFAVGHSLLFHTTRVEWSSFPSPEAIPAGARITDVYLVFTATHDSALAGMGAIYGGGDHGMTVTGGTVYSASLGTSVSGIGAYAIANDSVNGTTASVSVSFVGMAVYYMGDPVGYRTLLAEALTDVRVGAPVKIWFGMLSASGALVGTPYLVFSGLVDEPTINEDPTGTKIVLAFENRLRNLQRASQKRYTAADQKLSFPNDSGFNSVELLQEISLKWGS